METKHGTLYLVAGGDLHMKQIFRHMLDAVHNRLGYAPRIAYLGGASGDNPVFFHMMKSILRAAGAKAVDLAPLAPAHRDPEKAQRVLAACDLVFISGGDIDLGMQCLQEL